MIAYPHILVWSSTGRPSNFGAILEENFATISRIKQTHDRIVREVRLLEPSSELATVRLCAPLILG